MIGSFFKDNLMRSIRALGGVCKLGCYGQPKTAGDSVDRIGE